MYVYIHVYLYIINLYTCAFTFSVVAHVVANVFGSILLISDAFGIHVILSGPRLTRPDTTSNPSCTTQWDLGP